MSVEPGGEKPLAFSAPSVSPMYYHRSSMGTTTGTVSVGVSLVSDKENS